MQSKSGLGCLYFRWRNTFSDINWKKINIVPSNMYLDKIGRPSIYLPTCMVVWGIISGATGGVQNFAGLLTCRYCSISAQTLEGSVANLNRQKDLF